MRHVQRSSTLVMLASLVLGAVAAPASAADPTPTSSPSASPAPFAVVSTPREGSVRLVKSLRSIVFKWREPAASGATRKVTLQTMDLPAIGSCGNEATWSALVETDLSANLRATSRRVGYRPTRYLTCQRFSVTLTTASGTETIRSGWTLTGRDPKATTSSPNGPGVVFGEMNLIDATEGTTATSVPSFIYWHISNPDPATPIVSRKIRTYAYTIPTGTAVTMANCPPVSSPLYKTRGIVITGSASTDTAAYTYSGARTCFFHRLVVSDGFTRIGVADSARFLVRGPVTAASPTPTASPS